MPLITLVERARAVWESLAGVPVVFAPAMRVAVSPRSRLCPPGWVGLVVIADAAIATAPDPRTAHIIEHALSAVPAASVTDANLLHRNLAISDMLGPATLAYLDPADFRPPDAPAVIEQLDARDPTFWQFWSQVDAADLSESGIDQITSPAFTVREHGQITAAAGYRDWPGEVAHLSVLTALPVRGRGLARAVASAAVSHALRENKLPQWRARPEASRHIAQVLGFRELGSQVSICLPKSPACEVGTSERA